jgi:ATP-dependent Clp protease protease subunit
MPNLIQLPKKEENKNLFKIENKADDKAEMIIYGSIGATWEDSGVSAKQFHDELSKLPASTKEITLRINSPGGSVFDGITIYERLKQHKAKVIVYVDGMAASIASIIALAGDEIYISEGGFFMIHKPMTMTWGNDTDHEDTISVLQKIEDQMIGIYSRKTGISRAELSNMLKKDKWIKAEEAKELGFADKIIEASANMQVAASMLEKYPWAKTAPKFENKEAKAKLLEFKNRLGEFLAR